MQNRKGFTLIELLIVVVIIGILAAIALPKFGQTRERAYYTTMTADLTNLRSTQEMYYQTTGNFNYASDMSDLEFSASSGVHLAITGGDSGAWAATATHTALGSGHGCAIFYGEIDNSSVTYPTIPGGGTTVQATQEGRPVCDQ